MRTALFVSGLLIFLATSCAHKAVKSTRVVASMREQDLLLFGIGQNAEGFSSLPLSKLKLKVDVCDGTGSKCVQAPLTEREFPSSRYYENCPSCEGNIRGKFVSFDDLRALVTSSAFLKESEHLIVKWQLHEPLREAHPVALAQAGLVTSDILTGARFQIDLKDGTYVENLLCMQTATTTTKNIRLPLLLLRGFIKRVNCNP